ncbi:DUF3307 domain-containing protein [Myroides marinus]|uniref:DUF3307 domain-containing protein n=1 Tax=Myroides marinus TaxID=703342 RepID=UPI002574A5A0|nr:DUF3307 domain-containing protein [Myroides marinus]MDM1534505.1 DUF3307 domain-containing protein [Myroides marinus]MDM1541469.1 DUF3307 domain-containing protein [Myroides marinus]
MYPLIIKILIAHILGDFVLQSNKMVDDINSKKLKSKYLYIHTFIHFALIIILTGFKKEVVISAILLSFAHLIIDIFTKLYLSNKISSILNLIIDQSLHFISISLFIYYYYPYTIDFDIIFSQKNQILFLSIICLTFVTSIIIKKIVELFNYSINSSGLKDAGKYIGMLERLFVFLFVVTNFWEGIGFLLAAKSIFRFGDLKDNNDVKLTEYILIGTLLSFGSAIVIAKMYLKLINIT